MSQHTFQAMLTRLVIDPDFRDAFRPTTEDANDLTALERQRLAAIVSDKGLDATRMLHKSFRLTKLYSALPLTRKTRTLLVWPN